MSNITLFSLKKLSFSFHNNVKPLFNQAEFSITKNSLTFIRGKNGMGKSTLFNILQGTIAQSSIISAELEYDGKEYKINTPEDIPKEFTHNVKMVQQSFDSMIAPDEDFNNNLALAKLATIPGLHQLPQPNQFEALIKTFGINTTIPVHLLSGGQRQILALCMALQKEPKILLLDEPTAALDTQNSQLLMEFLQALQSIISITILIITHDKEVVENYVCGSYYELEDNLIKRKERVC